MSALAIVPARTGSKGIPKKNWTKLAGITPLRRALECARAVREVDSIVLTTDAGPLEPHETGVQRLTILHAGPPLHTDDCPMIDVVRDVLARAPGPPDQKIVLLQPTQPLRTPAHVRQALALLTPEVDSVVSVVELPRTQSHEYLCNVVTFPDGRLVLRPTVYEGDEGWSLRAWSSMPGCRQDAEPSYIRDGTVYAFWRRTVERYGNIYGDDHNAKVWPLVIPASETCSLDTMADWQEAERRLRDHS